jgi:hypothetical protein
MNVEQLSKEVECESLSAAMISCVCGARRRRDHRNKG